MHKLQNQLEGEYRIQKLARLRLKMHWKVWKPETSLLQRQEEYLNYECCIKSAFFRTYLHAIWNRKRFFPRARKKTHISYSKQSHSIKVYVIGKDGCVHSQISI